jgi:hypothetical protein
MIDKSTKILLAAIALGLFANAIAPLARPVRVRAAESFTCDGALKANAWGGVEATIGGYKVELSCR